MPERDRLIDLCHYRWGLPAVAGIYHTGGARFAPLRHSLDASAAALRSALRSLQRLGLVEPNPGYGHPLRPEYRLTETGRAVGEASAWLVDWAMEKGLEALIGPKWSLPVLDALVAGPLRFRTLQTRLSPITPRALASALRDLESLGVVLREIEEESHPPAVTYRLSGLGLEAAAILERIARQVTRA